MFLIVHFILLLNIGENANKNNVITNIIKASIMPAADAYPYCAEFMPFSQI